MKQFAIAGGSRIPSQEGGSSGWWGERVLPYPAIVDKRELAFSNANIRFPLHNVGIRLVYIAMYIAMSDESAECRKRCSTEAHSC